MLASHARRLALALTTLVVLALPVASSAQVLPGASVTVCQVTGNASAPQFAEVQISVDQLAAFLDQHTGSFVGACPSGGGAGGANGGGPTPPLTGAVTVCRVSGSASAPVLSEVLISVDSLAAFLNQNPGSFAGACPVKSGGGNAGSSSGGAGPLNAAVTVCKVTGSANAPRIAQLTLAVDEIAAFLNRNPGSFVGTCPGQGGTVTKGPGRILGIPAGAALSICQVTGNARALRRVQVNVAIDRVAAFLNQHPDSFVGLCPSAGDGNGTLGNEPLGYATICRVTGNADAPLAAVTVRVDELQAYLSRPGTITPAPASGCPKLATASGGSPPSTGTTGETRTVVVQTTPNTVVTATGAGVKESARSNSAGKAKLNVTPRQKGIVTVRGAGGRVIQRIGVASQTRSGRNLTG